MVAVMSTYEGKRYPVAWRWAHGLMSIEGDDEMKCVVDLPVTELIITTRETGDALRLDNESPVQKTRPSQFKNRPMAIF